jgi:hypothetical protein
VLCWALLGFMAVDVRGVRARRLAIACLLAGNIYGVAVYAFNMPSMAQVISLKQMVSDVRAKAATPKPFIVHPLTHGWGDTFLRYIPEARAVMIETGPGMDGQVELKKATDAILSDAPGQVWIIRRNRFPDVPDLLASWLEQNGYVARGATGYQPQRAFDLKLKDALKSVPALKFNPAPSQEFIWSVQQFDRAP